MKELIKINNEWVKEEAVEAKKRVVEAKEKESGCKDLGDIADDFRGDEPRPIEYKLSREWQDRVVLSEDLGSLRSILGWTLYQEWIRETITG